LKIKNMLRVEAHPPGAGYPGWFSDLHMHFDSAGKSLKSFHLPVIEPLIAASGIARDAGKDRCCKSEWPGVDYP
jgi:hypothetical protein